MHMIQLDNVALHYRIQGDPSGKPIVFANSSIAEAHSHVWRQSWWGTIQLARFTFATKAEPARKPASKDELIGCQPRPARQNCWS